MLKNYFNKSLFIVDKLVVFIIFCLLGVFQPDIVLLFVFLFAFFYLEITKRAQLFYYLYVSSLISFIWTIIGARYYNYNQDFMTIYGVSLFPFFAASLGLFAVYFGTQIHKLF